jgi:hypothetical protein
MKVQVVGFFAIIALANAGVVPLGTTLLHSPLHDSSIVRSERIGNSFAYSTVTANGYSPLVYQGVS